MVDAFQRERQTLAAIVLVVTVLLVPLFFPF